MPFGQVGTAIQSDTGKDEPRIYDIIYKKGTGPAEDERNVL